MYIYMYTHVCLSLSILAITSNNKANNNTITRNNKYSN